MNAEQLRFDGRVAVITGAGSGLGRSHAFELAGRGASVVVNDLGTAVDGRTRSSAPADAVVAQIRAIGGTAVADYHSVTEDGGPAAIVDRALTAFGQLDILVNNAGFLRDRSFAKVSAADLDDVVAVHLRGGFLVAQAAWSHMKTQRYGRIINVTSNSGLLGTFGQSNYGAAKMGLVGLTRVLALEGSRCGIHVNALAPMARTRMTEDLLGPIVERLRPELVAPVVAWLAHEQCSASGEIYSAAAGQVSRFFIGLTEGVGDDNLSAERVRELFSEIRDTRDWTELGSSADEIELLRSRLDRRAVVGCEP